MISSFNKKLLWVLCGFFAFFARDVLSAELSLREDSPDSYVVEEGDSLWKISGIFLNNPSRWPDIWQGNPAIGNPNLIFPGDVIVLRMVEGVPTLSVESSATSVGAQAEFDAPNVIRLPSLRVTEPTPGERLFFNSDRRFRAEIQFHQSTMLAFELITNEQTVLGPLEVDVSITGDVGVALATIRVPELSATSQAVLRVSTVGQEPALQREIPVLIERSDVFMEILGGTDLHIDSPAEFTISGSAGLRQIEWNFGDGWQAGGLTTQHAFNAYGRHVVRARAIGADGLLIETQALEVEVPVRPVAVMARLLVNGLVLGTEIPNAKRNGTIQLSAETKGDVRSLQWSVDGVPLPEDQTSITIDRMGRYKVSVTAVGTPEAGTAISEVEFGVSDRIVFFVILAIISGGMFVLGRLMLGNSWRMTMFEFLERSRDGELERPLYAYKLGLRTSWPFGKVSRNCGTWDFWRKQAQCDLLQLFEEDTRPPVTTSGHNAIIKLRSRDVDIINRSRVPQLHSAVGIPYSEKKYLGLWSYEPSQQHRKTNSIYFAVVRPSGQFFKRYWMDMAFLVVSVPVLLLLREAFNMFY